MSAQLLPCPHCDGPARKWTDPTDPPWFSYKCSDIGCSALFDESCDEEARIAWNRRAPLAAAIAEERAETDKLMALLNKLLAMEMLPTSWSPGPLFNAGWNGCAKAVHDTIEAELPAALRSQPQGGGK